MVKPEIASAFNLRQEKKQKRRYIDKIKSNLRRYTDISGRNNNLIDEHSWERIGSDGKKPILDKHLRTIEISTDGPSLFQELKVL